MSNKPASSLSNKYASSWVFHFGLPGNLDKGEKALEVKEDQERIGNSPEEGPAIESIILTLYRPVMCVIN